MDQLLSPGKSDSARQCSRAEHTDASRALSFELAADATEVSSITFNQSILQRWCAGVIEQEVTEITEFRFFVSASS